MTRFGPIPDGAIANPDETPAQTLARYIHDKHDADADRVIADLTVWAQGLPDVALGPPPPGVTFLTPDETPEELYARYDRDKHDEDRDRVLADILAWLNGPGLDIGPPPADIVVLPGETPTQVRARYVRDKHDSDLDRVLAEIDDWIAGKLRVPAFPRPGSDRAPLPPPEASDESGKVYVDLTPEFLAQPGATPPTFSPLLIRCDGYAFKLRRPASDYDPSCTIDWLESIGQNTNEGGTVLYQPLLVMYPPKAQDGILDDYATYNTHGLFSEHSQGSAAVRALLKKARAAGISPQYHDLVIDRFEDLASDHAMDHAIIGLEADLKLGNHNGQLDDLIRRVCAVCVPKGIPVWIHLSSTGGPTHKQNWACPPPGVEYVDWWEMLHLLGVTGLKGETWMWARRGIRPDEDPFSAQDDAWGGDSAGKMGAMIGYSRRGLQVASARHPDRPPLLYCQSETWSMPRFYGWTDTAFPLRRSRHLLACPEPGCPGIAGSDSGGMVDWNGKLI